MTLHGKRRFSSIRKVCTHSGLSTSPSIRVGFSNLYATDACGALSTEVNDNQEILYTILAFAPGELSTIEQPAWDRGSMPQSIVKSFNVADLPCPPQSVMVGFSPSGMI